MVARRGKIREGLGLMGVGGGVFAVAALVAAVASPLASELTSTIHRDVAPVAQASGVAPIPHTDTTVRVLRLPPFPMAGGGAADVPDADDAGPPGGRGLALGRSRGASPRAAAPEVGGLRPPLAEHPAVAPPAAQDGAPAPAPATAAAPGRRSAPDTAASPPEPRRGGPGTARTSRVSYVSASGGDAGAGRGAGAQAGQSADAGPNGGRESAHRGGGRSSRPY